MPSPTRSTRSSRASTPASDDENTPKILSPRSRIQAMLAEIDQDSDDELMTPSNIPMPNKAKRAPSPKVAAERRVTDAPESEEDDEPVVKPRGRLAARMAASAAPFGEDDSSSGEENEKDGGNVYQQIRRELLAEKTMQADMVASQEQHMPPQAQRAATPDTPSPSPPRRRLASRAQQLAESPASNRSESPGLFMSPGPERSGRPTDAAQDSDSEADLPSSKTMQSRLRELVERRRQEREAKQAVEEEAPEDSAARAEHTLLSDLFDDDEDVDRAAERKLTQQSRPTRKASKKALEEMNRETQRMSRNMQLTHLAKTKKKFTTADFLSRFGGGRTKQRTPLAQVDNVADSSSVAGPESDGEMREPRETPPSSPPSVDDEDEKESLELSNVTSATEPRNTTAAEQSHALLDSDDDGLPPVDVLGSSQYQERLTTQNKGKEPLPTQSPQRTQQNRVSRKLSPRQYRIVPPPRPTQSTAQDDDSDSDLEIIQTNRVSSIFDSIAPSKASESRPLHVLRHLAHINHSDKPRLKKGERPSMTPAQLEIELRRRAKIQAIMEREEKIASLKARGIIIMSAEEREREQVIIEDMLEKARDEADQLRKKEKQARKDAGEQASSDESEDGDYTGSADEQDLDAAPEDEEEDVELSGSEEEEEEDENNVLDNEAGEDNAEADEGLVESDDEVDPEQTNLQDAMDLDQPDESTQIPTTRRAPRRKIVVDDDEDEDEPATASQLPTSTGINDDLAAAFGFGPAPQLDVSQMFAGTMADSQDTIAGATYPHLSQQDSFAILPPSAPLPTFAPSADTQDEDTQDDIITDSQTENLKHVPQGVDLQFEKPAVETPSINRTASVSQYGDLDFTPSQDVGLRDDQTPLKKAIQPHPSTQETVLLDVPESPVVQQAKRKSRLVRRAVATESSDDEEGGPQQGSGANAFDKLAMAAKARKAKLAQVDFDRKASEAKKMVEEQAEESEDEYHGLGGASDDDAENDVADEADRAMIDSSDIQVDERELAALYAERARQENEAQTSKLYKDLMTGGLRKRAGAGGAFDLDSDEDYQEQERRRRRQREEARKRRLLLQQDEGLGKLGANEKKEAFLRAIEDRDSEDELDVLDGNDPSEANVPASQEDSQSQQQQLENGTQQILAETSANPLKRKQDSSTQQQQPSRKISRRDPLAAFKAPRSIAEVRESLSFLIEDAHIDPNANSTIFSDDEDDDDIHTSLQAVPRAPASERRTVAKPGVVDRLSLKKQSSSLIANDGSSADAFAAPAGLAALRSVGSFSKAPSLLRRATSNLASESTSTSMPPPPPRREGSGLGGNGVRMGGSKKSSINYQAREAERKVILEKAERKRKEGVRKTAGLRDGRGVSGFMKLGGGDGFE